MALEEFEKEQMSEREKGYLRMNRILNYGMGIFIIAVGCLFMFPTKVTARFLEGHDPFLIKIFAAICWLYGAFRIYRGYKGNFRR